MRDINIDPIQPRYSFPKEGYEVINRPKQGFPEDLYEHYKKPITGQTPKPSPLPPGVPRVLMQDSTFRCTDDAMQKAFDFNLTYTPEGVSFGIPIREMANDPRVSPEFKEKFYRDKPHLDPRKNT